MCCFSGPVERVSKTSIFARCDGASQFLVYAMTLASRADVAMILPVPAVAGDANALRFINLEDYPRFFVDLSGCFPVPITRGIAPMIAVAGAAHLPVERVGAFDASFVPSIADFDRLDPQFRLDPSVWSALPAYEDYGFAVFRLRAGSAEVHPMAFRFTSREPHRTFFPTVHIHDGTVPRHADFDHDLYVQADQQPASEWEQGSILPEAVMKLGNLVISDRTRGIVQPKAPVFRRRIVGKQHNADVWVQR